MSFKIGKRSIGADHPVFIIAEIGQNHQGDLKLAKQLIKIAKDCGADCAKFQKTNLAEKFNKKALNRPYSSINSWGATYGDHKRHLEFSDEQFKELQAYANEIGILFTASAMDSISLDFLVELQVPFIKIGSGDANNLILIEQAARKQVPLVISTGMLNFSQVEKIHATVSAHHHNFALLHCTSAYPTPPADVNLRVLGAYRSAFPATPVGYSGHELGAHITLAAVALGAAVVERHLTPDRALKGADHQCSLEPAEFRALVAQCAQVALALGRPRKEFQESEAVCYARLGKTVVAARRLRKWAKLELADMKIKVAEPKGLDGGLIGELVGRVLGRDVEEDESIGTEALL